LRSKPSRPAVPTDGSVHAVDPNHSVPEAFVSRNNLPVRLSSFIGPEHEVKELAGYLADHRLVTIAGSGGAGKTRLAIQAASAQLDQFPDGVWWLELAPVTDPSTIASTLARVVIGELDGSRPAIDLVTARLRDHNALIVFDNCEHLVEAAAEAIDTILQRCPPPDGGPGRLTRSIRSVACRWPPQRKLGHPRNSVESLGSAASPAHASTNPAGIRRSRTPSKRRHTR
jgi:hypothetical protein